MLRRAKIGALIAATVITVSACASGTSYYPDGQVAAKCRAWGQSECRACPPGAIDCTEGAVAAKGKGLSTNAVGAIGDSVRAVLSYFWPF